MTGGTASKEGSAKRAERMFHGNRRDTVLGLAQKQLVGIPWRVAFALQADGWYLRSDIIWSKPNPMPESVTDRPTKSHEYLFLLSKSPKYFFDADAVREAVEPHNRAHNERYVKASESYSVKMAGTGQRNDSGQAMYPTNPAGRNLRSVWNIATQPYPGAHFATFPRKLVEPCIKAGTSERGVCPECGAPWVRVVERTTLLGQRDGREATAPKHVARGEMGLRGARSGLGGSNSHNETTPQSPITTTIGWRPSCDHGTDFLRGAPSPLVTYGRTEGDRLVPGPEGAPRREPVPATILDPFAGSGTTAVVAQALGRRAVLIDLSTDYLDQIMRRNAQMPLDAA
jgi:hypothetical protein